MSIRIKQGNTGNVTPGQLESRMNRHENVIYAVILVLIFMLAQFLIEYFRFSSTTYKEYSQKTESVETTQKINQELLEQNRENQEIIIGLQKQILSK